MPTFEALRENTFAAFGDLDASATKALIALNFEQDETQRKYFEIAYAQRPAEELYEPQTDPHQIYNVASDERLAGVRTELSDRMMKVLRDSGDPRVIVDGTTFDLPPFSAPYQNQKKRPEPFDP